jgi:hypothetical protein
MAQGSTQPLREMSARNITGCKARPAHKTNNLTAICESNVYKMWDPRRFTASYSDSFGFYFLR